MKKLIVFILIFFLVSIASAEQIPILMYHNIQIAPKGARKVAKDLFCPPPYFWSHLLYIQQAGYQTVTFKDVRNHRFADKKKIILTFDDGLASQWDAYDELLKRNMVGVFFPVLRTTERNKKYLSSDLLKIMARTGMEIGSHTMTHPVLSRISLKKVEYEVKESKLALEKITGKEVITLCYPYGRYNNKVMQIAESAGYQYARTTNEKIADFGSGKNFELPIIYIHKDTDVEKLRKQLDK